MVYLLGSMWGVRKVEVTRGWWSLHTLVILGSEGHYKRFKFNRAK